MTAPKPYTSLDRALRNLRVPVRNDTFIKHFLHGIGIEGVYETSSYIVAVRRDGGPSLNIGRGSTNGFTSEEEVVRIAGEGARRYPSNARKGLWKVMHPEDPGGRESGPMSGRTPPRDYGKCPECFSPMAPSGFCTNAGCKRAE